MKFTLHYRGPLKSNGKPDHKNDIRNIFHHQLKALWQQRPLSEHVQYLQPRENGHYSLLRELSGFSFVPLVAEEMNVVAELELILLRPEAPGNLLTQGGDLDNRLKTLFDALTMPRHTNALPKNWSGNEAGDPYTYCLLEDDNLVVKLNVKTEQMLEPTVDDSIVDVFITVKTAVTRNTAGNADFA